LAATLCPNPGGLASFACVAGNGNHAIPPFKAEEEGMPMTASPNEIESARLNMVEARKALEEYEMLKGFASSCGHMRLIQVFTKVTATYLNLSATQR
jgi:hypothetical protein